MKKIQESENYHYINCGERIMTDNIRKEMGLNITHQLGIFDVHTMIELYPDSFTQFWDIVFEILEELE